MDNNRPALITTEEKNNQPLLVIDKKGNIGFEFSKKIAEQFLVVLVSSLQSKFSQNIIHISYQKRVPKIPDNNYSHMFVFYNGESEVLDMLPALINKANSIRAKLIFITSISYSSHKLLTHLSQHEYDSMKIIIYGEVFQTKDTHDNLVNAFLSHAHHYGRIILPHDLGKLYPVFIDDVFEAIIEQAFSENIRKKPLLVFPKHATSELSIARMIKKRNPNLKIDFKKYKQQAQSYYIPQGGEYYFNDYPLEKRLLSINKHLEDNRPSYDLKKIKIPHRRANLNAKAIFFALLMGFLLPIVLSVFVGAIGVGALFLSVEEIKKAELKQALFYANIAKTTLKTATAIGDQFDENYVLADTEVNLLESAVTLQEITSGQSKNPKEDFLHSLAVFKNSLITLQKMKAEGVLMPNINSKLSELEIILTPIENTLDSLPYLLGFEEKKTYLVLFQNNMELRSGGGFIGSYGILSIDNGRITDFKVNDVYDADGKLTTHIEPPFAIRRFLGASHWFLRDSNFAIDFPTNAEKASMFLKLETGQSVDGVIAVDTTFLKNILASVGPVEVPDYKETVNEKNFYILTQTHVEKDFFPGSTQKKDFLRSLLAAMQLKISSNNFSYVNLSKAIGESIRDKHLFFAFADPAPQKLFTVNNLSASLIDLRERKLNQYLDFFAVIDANLGLNKSNYYLKRSIEQSVLITPSGDIEETAVITYKNESTKDSAFAGDYKNYVRFVLPQGAFLNDIKIDNVTNKTVNAITDPEIFTGKNFLAPKELEVEKGKEQEKNTFGFLVTVPSGKSKKVAISYTVEKAVNASASAFAYNLRVFKQPGVERDDYLFSLKFPSVFTPVSFDNKFRNTGGKLFYSGEISQDMDFQAEFGKK